MSQYFRTLRDVATTSCVVVILSSMSYVVAKEKQSNVRTFEFTYAGTIKDLPADEKLKLWLPIPPTTSDQSIEIVESNLPGKPIRTRDKTYGNEMFFVELAGDDKSIKQNSLQFSVKYRVVRRVVNGMSQVLSKEDLPDAKALSLYLHENRMVPITGKPTALLEDLIFPESQTEQARTLYEKVEQHMAYDKSKPGYGNGDVLWACESRTGNCSDFHSLFISLCRSRHIPSKFQIGFPIPPDESHGTIKGYHCWARFFDEKHGWVPVDISEADKHPDLKEFYFGNLTKDRVQFTTGRDIVLEPKQSGESLNYFIYPYAEVASKKLGKEQFELEFNYKDVPAK